MKKAFAVLFAVILLGTLHAAAENDFLIVTPGGAPALAVAGVYAEHRESVQTVGADTIGEAFGSAEADFIIAPVNAGAKLFKAGKSSYRLAAVVTWGNLVFASKIEGFTPDMINGRKLILFGENTINSSVALYVLEEKGFIPSSVEYLAGAAETQALLINGDDPEVIVMTAEPAVTGAMIADEKIVSCPLDDLYSEVTGYDGFTQAGLFVREQTAHDNPEIVKRGLEEIRASAEMCSKDPETAAANAVAMEIVKAEKIALKALPGCNIRYMDAADAREQIEKTAMIDLKQFGGELPADDFYYSAD